MKSLGVDKTTPACRYQISADRETQRQIFQDAKAGIFYSISRGVDVAITLVMVSGFLKAPYGIIRRQLVQRNTPQDLRGRLNSAIFVMRNVVLLIGMAAGLADVMQEIG